MGRTVHRSQSSNSPTGVRSAMLTRDARRVAICTVLSEEVRRSRQHAGEGTIQTDRPGCRAPAGGVRGLGCNRIGVMAYMSRLVMGARARLGVLCCCGLLLAACEDRNKYQPPPPAEVGVQKPEQKRVTLVPRAHRQHVGLQQGRPRGARAGVPGEGRLQGRRRRRRPARPCSRSSSAPYQTSLQIAEATVQPAGSAAGAGRGRPQPPAGRWQQRQVASEARLDESRAKRNSTLAALDQAKGQVQQAKINLAYTDIKAPFAGVVTARLVDPGCSRRRGRANQARDHRPDRSDLRQLQRQRAAGAPDPRAAAQGRG